MLNMNVGVIGVGKIGSIHLNTYKNLKDIDKIYIVDIDKNKLLNYKDIPSFVDYKKLLNKVDIVSIATPTNTHFEIAEFFLKNNISVLLEKPITDNIKQAEKLIEISKKNKTILFAGHIERYNNAYLAIKDIVKNPLFIECHRISPYPNRSLDISVVLDLMIHDLDIILDLVNDKIKKIEAKGVCVLSKKEDIANTRITFQNGCVANITSSRISNKRERKIRIFLLNCYISLDYANQEVQIYKKIKNKIISKTLEIKKEEPFKKEIEEFINLVKNKKIDFSSIEKAKEALEVALKIEEIIKKDSIIK